MCGIVGYIGKEPVNLFEVLKNGLIGLEYRGYDSAGIAYFSGKGFEVIKCVGGPGNLTARSKLYATAGIGHTRWATHGGISEKNAHPHFGPKKKIAVVHNGTVENFADLLYELKKKGVKLLSTTDTELIACLIEKEYTKGNLRDAVYAALDRVVGAYGIAVIAKDEPDKIIAARRGSPLLIGLGQDSLMIGSDRNALTEYCTQIIYLDDNEIVELTTEGFSVSTKEGAAVKKKKHKLERQEHDTGLGRYKHYMIKEIEEQALTLKAALSGRLDPKNGTSVLGGVREILPELQKVTNVILTGCGTAFHAALYGKYLFEQILNVPVRAEIASELQYTKVNEPPETTLVIFVSQSGETADTKDILIELKQRGYLCLGIVNVAGSSIAREAGVGVYIRAGVERAVASTKAFTSQIMALVLLGITMSRQRGMSKIEGQNVVKELEQIPGNVKRILKESRPKIRKFAKKLVEADHLYFLGKKYSYPVALEGSLKTKEITYIPTETYPAGEIKHGPLALVDKNFTAFVVAPEKNLFDKLSNTVHEIKARGGKVILVTNEGMKKDKLLKHVDEVILVPEIRYNFLYPFYTVIPFQLLSYEMALLMNREIDKPRNLAKSVTVQ